MLVYDSVLIEKPKMNNVILCLILSLASSFPMAFAQDLPYTKSTRPPTKSTTIFTYPSRPSTTPEPLPPITGCDPWPKNTKFVKECCIYPHHSVIPIERLAFELAFNQTEFTQIRRFTTQAPPEPLTNAPFNDTARIIARGKAIALAADHYLRMTKLLVNGKFDKEIQKNIYKNYSRINKKFLGEDPWLPIIDAAVESCTFNSSTNNSFNLEQFYSCADKNLWMNCPVSAIDSSDECEATLEFYEKCKKAEATCTEYPLKLMLPEYCCNYPEILSQKVMEDCRQQSKDKTMQAEKAKFTIDCINKKLELRKNGKLDFGNLKKLLASNASKKGGWDKSIDKSVDSCKPMIEEIEGTANEHQVDAALKICLREALSDNCAEFRVGDASCNRVKKFMTKCPEIKPKRQKIIVDKKKEGGKTTKETKPEEMTTAVTPKEDNKGDETENVEKEE